MLARAQAHRGVTTALIGVACALSLLGGMLAAGGALRTKPLIVATAGIVVTGLLLSPRRHWALLCAGIATIAVGHRSIRNRNARKRDRDAPSNPVVLHRSGLYPATPSAWQVARPKTAA